MNFDFASVYIISCSGNFLLLNSTDCFHDVDVKSVSEKVIISSIEKLKDGFIADTNQIINFEKIKKNNLIILTRNFHSSNKFQTRI